MEYPRIILASSSPRRKELFSQLDIPFEVISSGVDETIEDDVSPEDVVRLLALRKADFVAQSHSEAIIIGADSMVVLDGKMIGKPLDEQDAISTLRQLSNRSHIVVTGMAVIDTRRNSPKAFSQTYTSIVTMNQNSDQTIITYVATGEPLDKAGSYSRSGLGKILIKSIEGSADNVSGLPVDELKEVLKTVFLLDETR